MLKNLRRSLFHDGTEVLARKVESHHERPFRPWLRVANAVGSPWGAFKEEECYAYWELQKGTLAVQE